MSRVAHGLLKRLPVTAYEIHHLAVNYKGDPHDVPWKVYPAGLRGDVYGVRRLGELIDRVDPHIVFLHNDPWVIAEYLKVHQTLSLPANRRVDTCRERSC